MSEQQQGSGTPQQQQQNQGIAQPGQQQAAQPGRPGVNKGPEWVGPGPRPTGQHPILGCN